MTKILIVITRKICKIYHIRIVLFDLGNTLVNENTLTLISGANDRDCPEMSKINGNNKASIKRMSVRVGFGSIFFITDITT